ncbi:ATP-binding cassette domain-containing protein [Spiribacter vilamensis]|uniref:ATP-binding protein Uup n=1 Tax=Spiribacter vilamensis TaxID=531306 RepID=A0A4Q8CZ65_9GAMM|nr:ATP-binding cassette domain-containing protein [Spiribacter vilamensis]RZU98299.1 ATP-binding cassette subfamily F protein uup [Spiribacter vilamensis]TVO60809.1 ATP-binding cassette domain-containing protein [Spiribacter vilamensis]
MSLIRLDEIEFSVGGPPLLEHASLTIEDRERVCLVGRNGVGKSTLLRVIEGAIEPDAGRVQRGEAVTVSRLEQAVPDHLEGRVFDVVTEGLGDLGSLLSRHHDLAMAIGAGEGDIDELTDLQSRIEAAGGWQIEQRVDAVLTRFDLPADSAFSNLSGGLKRRVLLARAVVPGPDVLLLDEPTNHLDIEAIRWLEGFMREFNGAVIFVTHDRAFLQAVATRIVEIDRGQLTSWPGDYANYLRRCEERDHAEAEEQARFDKKLKQEEAWIRQGIKARRTRNEGRVRALQAMRKERAERRERPGEARLTMAEGERSGKRVIEAEHLTYAIDGKPLVTDFSTRIIRGDRIGILGPNGVGKTTLIRLLVGELAPDSGSIKLGTGLQVAYFDQHRASLDDRRSARENVAGGEDFIDLGDGKRRHVMGYLQDFLFSPDRANAPISRLSGGERNRLLLAQLFARPSNLLVLDEPTNDLDVETLELLEERLVDYTGTLLLVSHDRTFLDNVVTSVFVPEGGGRIGEYVGGYADWLRQTQQPARSEGKASKTAGKPASSPKKPRKLTYSEGTELDELPARIETLEAVAETARAKANDPGLYQQDADTIQATLDALEAAEAELSTAYERWEYLEAQRERLG